MEELGIQLGINHQSPLIYWDETSHAHVSAGNQSPIPFDILTLDEDAHTLSWESITNPL